MPRIVWEYHSLGGGGGGWEPKQEIVAIYKNEAQAIRAIKRAGCSLFKYGRWTREPREGEYFSSVASYIISDEIPWNPTLTGRR